MIGLWREYQKNLKNIETNQYSLDHPTYKVYTLYDVLGPEHIDKVSEEIAENIENLENADEIFDKIKNFKPIDKSDLGVTYPIKDKLEEILKKISWDGLCEKLIQIWGE